MAIVKINTSFGTIRVQLYDETPVHRDNFLKLAAEGFYNGTLFHRVVKDFMIQGGDPDSKGAPQNVSLGVGGPGYTLEAEIKPELIHKRGVLAAARQGDEVNPERRSSGSQFYIVWGEVYNDGQLGQINKQLQMQAQQQILDGLIQQNRSEVIRLRKSRDQEGLMELQEKLIAESRRILKEKGPFGLTDLQREVYKTMGGVPFLDGQYTVFGEVIEGLDVVEKIQGVSTNRGERPKEDIPMTVEVEA